MIFFTENPRMTTSVERLNSSWTKRCYKDAGLQKTKDFLTTCSGTVMGKPKAISNLVSLMMKEISVRCCSVCDQGHLNWIVYSLKSLHKYFSVELQVAGYGAANTVAFLNSYSGGPCLNSDSSLSPTVHQYDRVPLVMSDRLIALKELVKNSGTAFKILPSTLH